MTLLDCYNKAFLCVSCRLAAFAARRGGGKMPSPSFTLDAQLRFHDKWLKIDLQVWYSIKGENYCPFELRGQRKILWAVCLTVLLLLKTTSFQNSTATLT